MSLIFFFAHQCNTTVSFVAAVCSIIESPDKSKDCSIYHRLAKKCLLLREQATQLYPQHNRNRGKNTDVGSGIYPRFQCSNIAVMSEEDLEDTISQIYCIFERYICLMNEIKKKDTIQKLTLHQELNKELKATISGFGKVRAMHMIQMSSLLNLIPLDYYVYTPLHTSGGTGSFLSSMVSTLPKKISEKDLLAYNSSELKLIQKSYTEDLTANMFENACCIISRKKKTVDIYYHLPFVNVSNVTVVYSYDIQILFRVHGFRKSKWTLESKSNGEIHDISNLMIFDGCKVEDLKLSFPILDKVLFEKLFLYKE